MPRTPLPIAVQIRAATVRERLPGTAGVSPASPRSGATGSEARRPRPVAHRHRSWASAGPSIIHFPREYCPKWNKNLQTLRGKCRNVRQRPSGGVQKPLKTPRNGPRMARNLRGNGFSTPKCPPFFGPTWLQASPARRLCSLPHRPVFDSLSAPPIVFSKSTG